MCAVAAFYSLMISDENALETFTVRAAAQTPRRRPGVAQLATIAVALHRIPIRVLRYAAVRNAIAEARLRKAPTADCEPDPFGTEPAFLSDFEVEAAVHV